MAVYHPVQESKYSPSALNSFQSNFNKMHADMDRHMGMVKTGVGVGALLSILFTLGGIGALVYVFVHWGVPILNHLARIH